MGFETFLKRQFSTPKSVREPHTASRTGSETDVQTIRFGFVFPLFCFFLFFTSPFYFLFSFFWFSQSILIFYSVHTDRSILVCYRQSALVSVQKSVKSPLPVFLVFTSSNIQGFHESRSPTASCYILTDTDRFRGEIRKKQLSRDQRSLRSAFRTLSQMFGHLL